MPVISNSFFSSSVYGQLGWLRWFSGSTAWPARWLSCAPGLGSSPGPMFSSSSMLNWLKSNLAKIMSLNIVLGFLNGLVCWKQFILLKDVQDQEHKGARGAAVAGSMISWGCREPSGWNYICFLGKLMLLCHFFHRREKKKKVFSWMLRKESILVPKVRCIIWACLVRVAKVLVFICTGKHGDPGWGRGWDTEHLCCLSL